MIGHHVSSGMQYGGCSKCVCVYYIPMYIVLRYNVHIGQMSILCCMLLNRYIYESYSNQVRYLRMS